MPLTDARYYTTLKTSRGYGIQGAGVTAAGIGEPATIVDNPEPSDGSMYINPYTKDYELDASTGQLAQMPPVRQMVLLALSTIKGTATALPWLGISYPSKITQSFESECIASVNAALSHLTREDDPQITIDRVSVEVASGIQGRAKITVSYTDLTTGEYDAVSI